MKIKYFEDTDTLYIEFRADPNVETRDLDENTLIELDAAGQICTMTMEHAIQRTEAEVRGFDQVAKIHRRDALAILHAKRW